MGIFILIRFFLQSFINTGDYDDEEEWPDLEGTLEAYKSTSLLLVIAAKFI